MWKPNLNLATANGSSIWNSYGLKFFELSNHLGNVMAVVSDNRLQTGNTYAPDVINSNDYYAFGGQMNGRDFTNSGAQAYRYGFNGKENDNEVKGQGNQQDYGMRIYDPRIGKFLSVNPITAEYPMLTPYQFASNTPIMAIDLDGLEMMSPMSMQVGINHIETHVGRKAMAGDKNAQKAFSIMMRNNKKVLGMGMTVTTTAMIIPYSASVIGYVIRNPQSLMNATSLTWGLLTDEDIPGNFADDAARNARNSITLLERQAEKKVVENIGDVREALVAELSGGKIAKIDGKDIVVRSKDGLIGATVDVFGGKGELITVGGASKAGKKIGKFISTVTGLKKIAAERGVKAQAYMADNTPVGLINKLEEILGKENVIKFKDK